MIGALEPCCDGGQREGAGMVVAGTFEGTPTLVPCPVCDLCRVLHSDRSACPRLVHVEI